MEIFTTTDFLSNDKFIEWHLTGDEELGAYWADFAARNPQCADAMRSAKTKLDTMRINDFGMSGEDRNMLLRRIRNSVESHTRRRKFMRYTAAAASAAIIAVAAYFLIPQNRDAMETTIVGRVMPSQDIRLEIGGEVVAIGDNAEIELSGSGRVSIREEGRASEMNVEPTAAIHTLITPKGKRSSMILPDGSKIWLNSGSQLEFSSDLSRERKIAVRGEAFVEAAHDPLRPFVVNAADMTVRVYGTKFNVYAYDDDPEKSVLLVEGEVEVTHAGKSQVMKPNGLYSLHGATAEYKTVANADDYYSWTRGILSFENAPVSQILEKVGRYYNVEFRGDQLGRMSKTCSGKLILSDDLDDILESMCLISGYEFEHSGDVVYMTGPKN